LRPSKATPDDAFRHNGIKQYITQIGDRPGQYDPVYIVSPDQVGNGRAQVTPGVHGDLDRGGIMVNDGRDKTRPSDRFRPGQLGPAIFFHRGRGLENGSRAAGCFQTAPIAARTKQAAGFDDNVADFACAVTVTVKRPAFQHNPGADSLTGANDDQIIGFPAPAHMNIRPGGHMAIVGDVGL
jgi:hypothetical protein